MSSPPQKTSRDVVLVVDDSAETVAMLADALETAGATALVALRGERALAIAHQITPDIVLLDAVMPGMDGFETCRAFKSDEALAHIPVIFMTGLADSDHVVQGLEAGGVDYVTKPIDPKALLARIRVHLANARLTQRAQAALDTTGRHLFAVDESGRLLWWTPQGGRILARLCGERPTAGLHLSEAVSTLVSRVAAGTSPPPVVVTPEREVGGPVEVAVVGRVGQGEILLRLVEEARPSTDGTLRDRLRVSDREAQVLDWIARGKSNRDIGDILGLSPRTINKHLERIFKKIGVENRTSAAVMVLKTLNAEKADDA
ncbi:MAG: DNA-binding response regulator [Hyphomicrobiales bacterium]|nr:DNA-binding response regulator [Hyphomicrobiales bacterium]